MAKDKKAKHGEDAARAETIEKLKNLKQAAEEESKKASEAAAQEGSKPEAAAENKEEAKAGEAADTGADAKKAAEAAEPEGDKANSTGDTASDTGADGEEAGSTEGSGEKKGLFGKKDKEKDKLKEQITELNDRVVRQMAEFENFRKRTEKEKEAMFETGAKSVLEKLLPVVDNFERGIAVLSEEESATPFAEGIQKVYRQLIDELTKLDVKPIEAVGQEFDPNKHNAVMHVDDETVGDNMVVEELQKGYTYRENVIRHSMVKVAN